MTDQKNFRAFFVTGGECYARLFSGQLSFSCNIFCNSRFFHFSACLNSCQNSLACRILTVLRALVPAAEYSRPSVRPCYQNTRDTPGP